jgi:oligopeptide/dipeptide ABC transporter ATP-binding protein
MERLIPILQINNLNVIFPQRDRNVLAVRDLSISVNEGETLSLAGESGCGKSAAAYSVLRLINPPGKIISGQVIYKGRDLCTITEKKMQQVRGKEISMIFQEPMTSLNPVFSIGFQISQAIRLHLNKTRKEAVESAIEILNMTGIPNPRKRYNAYPHELSGGMRQRVMIAIALSAQPSLLIADEPTTALDMSIQAQILDLLLNIQKDRKMSLILITHDLGIAANASDYIAIMYAGEVMEYGRVQDIFSNPLHPYTIGLFEAIPKLGEKKAKLNTIPGTITAVTQKPASCVFYQRCSKRTDECIQSSIKLDEKKSGHSVRCVKVSRVK